MAIIKCKMCGGDLNITEGVSVAECEYCGTRQTVPNVDSEKKTSLFLRAEKLRRECDFDRAAAIYDSIITDFPAEPEAYWGLVLCKYGIEYVDDPVTGKKVPTCHRSSFNSVMEDENLEKVMDCADVVARRMYREEAKAIEEIRKGILEVSGKEMPYDIFICYKETDENGERTIDSVLAQDVYDALTEKGYRVFFSRITLEDKLGTEYEPYIFAALNSAKIMLVFGTDYEHFNAVWVKNEWSRYLKLMAQDKSKYLIPCYKDVDAYDMPKEFQKLQAQDLGKVGAVQDLLRGIDKLLGKGQETKETVSAPAVAAGGPTVDSLLKRGQMFLADENWKSADEYFDKVLDLDPECAEAYAGKFCASRQYCQIAEMIEDGQTFSKETATLWKRALEFASPELRAQLEGYLTTLEKRKQEKAKEAAKQSELDKERLAPMISAAQGLLAASYDRTVGLRLDGTVVATGSNVSGECNVSNWRNVVAVYVSIGLTIGLKADGTVVVAGNDRWGNRVSKWQDIMAICTEWNHTVGLKVDGTVVAVGKNEYGQCNVEKWRNIQAISASSKHTVGLKAGGTVVAVGENQYGQCNVEKWQDIVAVCTGTDHTVGLRADGTVVAVGQNESGQCNVSDWRDIAAISAGSCHTVGLKTDGTVVAAGEDVDGKYSVSGWKNIAVICAEGEHIVGLRTDGTAVGAGENEDGECNVSDWRDIVAICAAVGHTVGLKADGTVVVAGNNEYGRFNVAKWKLFDDLLQERQAAQQRWEETMQRRKEALALHKEENRVWLPKKRAQAERAASLLIANKNVILGLTADGRIVSMGDSGHFEHKYLQDWRAIKAVSAGDLVIAGLHIDGTVVFTVSTVAVENGKTDTAYGPFDTQNWTGIIDVAAGLTHIIGLKADGTVVATGNQKDGPCNVAGWSGIVSIAAGARHTVGLKADGTVVAVGKNEKGQCNVSQWSNISSIIAYDSNTIGLRRDGTVAATGDNEHGQCNVEDWKEIVAVAAGMRHTIGLCGDGTVVATGENKRGQCNVQQWEDIVAVAGGVAVTYGLKADGTVVVTGSAPYGIDEVKDWRNIVAITSNSVMILGLRADGTAVIAGKRPKIGFRDFQQPIESWKLFDHIDTLEEERRLKLPRAALEAEQDRLKKELASLGIFSGKRRKQVQARLAEIEKELETL